MSCENWITLKEDNDYEINDQTFQIRRKTGKKRVVSECVGRRDGYVLCRMNNKLYRKHRVIANNFIPNPNNFEIVDHVNHDKTDNRVSNLRWCSNRMNLNNLSKQKFVDKLPDDAIPVEEYNGWKFEFLYYSPENDTFFVYNGLNYVVKQRILSTWGYWKINVHDKTEKQRAIYYNKFKKQYGLI